MNRPNHTTVVAYLALFIALGAGTAFAAGQLAKNSVGSKQLKKNAVTGAKVKKDAITSAKVKDASLLGADLADGTITGAKIADGSLSATDISGGVRASNVIGVAMTKDCGPAAAVPGRRLDHDGGLRLHRAFWVQRSGLLGDGDPRISHLRPSAPGGAECSDLQRSDASERSRGDHVLSGRTVENGRGSDPGLLSARGEGYSSPARQPSKAGSRYLPVNGFA